MRSAAVASRPPHAAPRWAAISGIVLGALAFWLALPPIGARAPWWPVLAGLLGVAAGIWAVTRGIRRAGWIAVTAGIIGRP